MIIHREKMHRWDVTAKEAVAIQLELAHRVVTEDDFREIRYVAGVDVGFEEGGAVTRAAVVVLDYATLDMVESQIARVPTTFPYVPGLLSFREIPAVLKAMEKLEQIPDIILCDGQGIAHQRKFGIASHLGVLTGVPSIGVAKSRLVGLHDEVPNEKGGFVPLMYKEEQIGVVLRSRANVRPLYISPGHNVSIESSVKVVMNCLTKYRLPETTRWAHKLASGLL